MEELNPESARVLALASQFQAALEGQFNRMNDGTFTATDEAETVEVKINGYQWLTGIKIEKGLLDLGVETVNARVNEALQNAQHAAGAYNKVAGEQLTEVLDQINRAMNQRPV
jgi:DNA-binding protein YbaB